MIKLEEEEKDQTVLSRGVVLEYVAVRWSLVVDKLKLRLYRGSPTL